MTPISRRLHRLHLADTSPSFSIHKIFSSLSTRNYRLFFIGQLISTAGTWTQAVALSFLVLRLTGSGTALGIATAVRFFPFFLFGPFGGLVADRVDKRRLLYWTQSLSSLLAGAFALLIAEGEIRMWMVYLLGFGLGVITVFDNPARQSLIAEMVPRDQISNAVSLNSVTINIARVFGAALGGVFVAILGLAWCFTINGLSFFAVLLTLAIMNKAELFTTESVARSKGQVRAGIHYARATPELLLPLVMVAVVGTLAWEFPVTLPLMATQVFHKGAGTYGIMASFMAGGAVVGGLVVAARIYPRAQALSMASVGWGVAILAASLAPSLVLEVASLTFVGYGSITFNSMAKTALQLTAVPAMRGRVMALWAVAWSGSTLIGGPLIGWIAQESNARWSLIVGGISALLVGVATWPALRRIDQRSESESSDEDRATLDEAHDGMEA